MAFADHTLGPISWDFYGMIYTAECSCSNPDGNGDGLVQFTSNRINDLEDQHHDHAVEFAEPGEEV